MYPPTGIVYISRHVIFDKDSYPFSDKYKHLQQAVSTPLMDAWKKSFYRSQPSAPETRQVPLEQTVERQLVVLQQLLPQFTEQDFLPLGNSVSTSAHASSTVISSPPEEPQSNPQPAQFISLVNHQHVTGQQSAPETHHPMITRSKIGIWKPNPRYVLITSKISYLKPRTVTEALKDGMHL